MSEYERGVRAACDIARSYNSCTNHPYDLGDCILLKFNMIKDKRKMRRNKYVHKTPEGWKLK
jgi:carotenoid cleavage dioxygenase-like enzyme